MRHLELHIIQSFPVSCLNRDDFGSPKTAVFDGVTRARVSSQCWKRSVREMLKEEAPQYFSGMRSKLIVGPLKEKFEAKGLDGENAAKAALDVCNVLAKPDPKEKKRLSTLFFASGKELDAAVEEYLATKDAKKAAKALARKLPSDAADIALFGRMTASDHSLSIDGAAMFAHALSTHRVSNELDFFSAVDDLKPNDAEDAGAAMTGTIEFNSATYYRFAALNLDLLEGHLSGLSQDERKAVVRAFARAVLMAVPSARRNSMNADTLPSFVLAVVRSKGHPVQLANAFAEPAWAKNGGLAEVSRAKLEKEYASMKATWGLEADMECRVPNVALMKLLDEVSAYVR